MNVVIHEDRIVKESLGLLAQRLTHLFGGPTREIKWVFPNGGVPDDLPTWLVPLGKNEQLLIGLRPEFRWRSVNNPELRRCPFLISIGDKKALDKATPTVEINIPRPMRRTVNGCFVMNSSDGLWLFHRGNRLTVQGNLSIPRADIHSHFKHALTSAWDGGHINEFIPVVRIESDKHKFQSDLFAFANSIKNLKESWASNQT